MEWKAIFPNMNVKCVIYKAFMTLIRMKENTTLQLTRSTIQNNSRNQYYRYMLTLGRWDKIMINLEAIETIRLIMD